MQVVKLVKVADLTPGDVLADHGKVNKEILALVDSGSSRWAHFAGASVKLDMQDVRSVLRYEPSPEPANYAAERAALKPVSPASCASGYPPGWHAPGLDAAHVADRLRGGLFGASAATKYTAHLNRADTPAPTIQELHALLAALQAKLLDSRLMVFMARNFEDLSDDIHNAAQCIAAEDAAAPREQDGYRPEPGL
jgi:hypothetical protein